VNTIAAPIDPERANRWLARLSSILDDLRDAMAAAPGDAALERRCLEVRALRTLVRRVRYGLVDAAELHERLQACTTPRSPEESAAGASSGPASGPTADAPSRDFDAGALERARLLRADTLSRVGSAQFLEPHAPAEALRRYRLALADVLVYARMPVERGLLAELKDVDRCGEPIVLDRLTRLLARLGRRDEARAAAQRYFMEFPAAVATAAGQRVRRRCARLALLD
jgi:hypothetical protein